MGLHSLKMKPSHRFLSCLICPSGVTAAARVLGTRTVRCGGSIPLSDTKEPKHESLSGCEVFM